MIPSDPAPDILLDLARLTLASLKETFFPGYCWPDQSGPAFKFVYLAADPMHIKHCFRLMTILN